MLAKLLGLIGGPWGTIVSFATSFAGKVTLYLGLAAVVAGSLLTIYLSWKHDIQEVERQKFEIAQKDDLIKNQTTTIQNMKDLAAIQDVISQQHIAADREIDMQADSVRAWLASQDPKTDRESSDILKNTFRKLYGEQK